MGSEASAMTFEKRCQVSCEKGSEYRPMVDLFGDNIVLNAPKEVMKAENRLQVPLYLVKTRGKEHQGIKPKVNWVRKVVSRVL